MQEHEMHHDPSEAKRLYVIVRADIPVGYQMAQACHAAAAIGAYQPQNLNRYPTIVILNADGLEHLFSLFKQAREAGEPSWSDPMGSEVVEFHEPDLGGEMTAFAVFSNGELFRDLQLAGGGEKPAEALLASP